MSHGGFVTDVPEGSAILIDDGDIALRAVRSHGSFLECMVEDGGMLGSRKASTFRSQDMPSFSN